MEWLLYFVAAIAIACLLAVSRSGNGSSSTTYPDPPQVDERYKHILPPPRPPRSHTTAIDKANHRHDKTIERHQRAAQSSNDYPDYY